MMATKPPENTWDLWNNKSFRNGWLIITGLYFISQIPTWTWIVIGLVAWSTWQIRDNWEDPKVQEKMWTRILNLGMNPKRFPALWRLT